MALYFITETYLKSQTGISANVDTQDVLPYVQVAADQFMSIILGREYYDYLVDKYNAQTLTADEITLVEHIQPAVAWRAAEKALPFAWAQWKNKGPQLQNGEYSNGVTRDDLAFMRNEFRNQAEYYENRVVRFLTLNKDDYPGYTADSNKTDTPPSDEDNFDNLGMMII